MTRSFGQPDLRDVFDTRFVMGHSSGEPISQPSTSTTTLRQRFAAWRAQRRYERSLRRSR